MFVGIDVYHAPIKFIENQKVYKRRRSIGAFISVIYQKGGDGQYMTTCDIVDVVAGKELIGRDDSGASDTDSVVSDSADAAPLENEGPLETRSKVLENFIRNTCTKKKINPTTIIVYRDGVGDGQIDLVKSTEVNQIRQACPHAKVIYTVVKKRIHTRFFVQTNDNRLGNPPPGTIVNELQHRDYPGFFLIPTSCSMSTVKPVHYTFVENSGHIPIHEFQRLTFALCHLYPNWPDAIKLPLPTQLAHKLAWQMGEATPKNPSVHQNFFSTCFYL